MMTSELVEQAVGVVMRENACDASTAALNLRRSAARQHVAVEEVATMVLTIVGVGDYAGLGGRW